MAEFIVLVCPQLLTVTEVRNALWAALCKLLGINHIPTRSKTGCWVAQLPKQGGRPASLKMDLPCQQHQLCHGEPNALSSPSAA